MVLECGASPGSSGEPWELVPQEEGEGPEKLPGGEGLSLTHPCVSLQSNGAKFLVSSSLAGQRRSLDPLQCKAEFRLGGPRQVTIPKGKARVQERESVCVCVCDVCTGMSEMEQVTQDDTIRYDDDGEYDEETEDASMVAKEMRQDKERYKGP